MPRIIPRRRSGPQHPQHPYPPPFLRSQPEPARRRMPPGWKPAEEFDYLTVRENFYVGTRSFARGDHVRRDDPLALKLLFECPDWVHPVDLKALAHKEVD
jgi:hypothetical protein